MIHGGRILIVDDEKDIRDSLEEFFEDEGYAVLTAGDGSEALSLLEDGEVPAVVILDLIMPRLGGAELYEMMQSNERLSAVPVIVSTSDPTRAPGGLFIMKKPINLERLLTAVRQCCH